MPLTRFIFACLFCFNITLSVFGQVASYEALIYFNERPQRVNIVFASTEGLGTDTYEVYNYHKIEKVLLVDKEIPSGLLFKLDSAEVPYQTLMPITLKIGRREYFLRTTRKFKIGIFDRDLLLSKVKTAYIYQLDSSKLVVGRDTVLLTDINFIKGYVKRKPAHYLGGLLGYLTGAGTSIMWGAVAYSWGIGPTGLLTLAIPVSAFALGSRAFGKRTFRSDQMQKAVWKVE